MCSGLKGVTQTHRVITVTWHHPGMAWSPNYSMAGGPWCSKRACLELSAFLSPLHVVAFDITPRCLGAWEVKSQLGACCSIVVDLANELSVTFNYVVP